ncbi:MAG: sulfatase-like hydrolase/transferase [Clostridia bacterium]|nr:sulfatase-like hydrolase/transferase [Clostridia bacterium]
MTTNNSRRNVVMILCDQLRADFLNAYGADFIPTPNIDALAANGVTFDNAITASTVCSPARSSILTGEFVSGHGGWTNNVPLNPGVETLTERLVENGYMTAAVGVFEPEPPDEKNFGFHYFNQFTSKPDSNFMKFLKSKHPEATGPWAGVGEDGLGLQFEYPEEDHYDRWIADRATEFIDTYVSTGKAPNGVAPENEDAPFFLSCGFLSPHSPHLPPKEVEGTVDIEKIPSVVNSTRDDVADVEKTRRAFLNSHEEVVNPESAFEYRMKQRRAYCEMIVEIDNLVGRIVKSLKDNGVYENTTIIFSSDHGSVENDYNVMTKGPFPYKAQLFIPLIIANDPQLKKGTHCDALCGNLDIGATVLDIVGDDRRFGVSRSMIGLSNGTVPEREVNMSEFCDTSKTVVDRRYTYMYYLFSGQSYLYDRINDPNEMTNLSGKPEYAEIENKFLKHIIDFSTISKGIKIEAHDLVHSVQDGIVKKDPKFLENFDICFPIASMREIERLKEAGLPWDYNEFCKEREIKAHYGVYFL